MALILLALAPRKVGTVEPGFSEYRALARQFGAELLYTEGLEELNWQAPPENIEQLMERWTCFFSTAKQSERCAISGGDTAQASA